MKKPVYLQIAVPTPMRRYFDYLPAPSVDVAQLKTGARIRVPFQRRELIGIFIGLTSETSVPLEKLKTIIEVIDEIPVIPADILQLCQWAADYYHYPLGEVLSCVLPAALRQGKPAELSRAKSLEINSSPAAPLALNAAQQTAVEHIKTSLNQFQVFLLDGVTGSGKTEVYLQTIAAVLAQQKQVLVLVPEIGLTPQTIQRFRARFSVPIIALHSAMTEKQRLHAWLHAKNNNAKIIIGTRSAVFTPFADLGLIILDEEHDLSFKQQDTFRYHARDVAIIRARFANIPVVLGSATPSLETLHNAKQNRYQYLCLPQRAGKAKLPHFQILDIRNQYLEEGLSPVLLQTMKSHLEQGEQVMLFLNRRGFAPTLMCHVCGWTAKCKRCDARLTYHQKFSRLHCHHCDGQKFLPKNCEACQSKELHAIGHGTERIEFALEKHFPEYSIVRIDRDTTRRKGAMEDMLEKINTGAHQILVGTQMLAKGHHFPNVTLVAIVDTDGGFFSSDFRAVERMGQLVLQVAGRAGRDEKIGKVLLQTRHPDHPLLQQLLRENYQTFSTTLLQEREQAKLPPYAFFALFRAEAHRAEQATQFLQEVKNLLMANESNLYVMGPVAAPMPMRAGKHRVQLLLQTNHRSLLQKALKNLVPALEQLLTKQRVRWSLDVDPLEMF